MRVTFRIAAVAALLLGLAAPVGAAVPAAVPRAECGPGSAPETGVQGQVPLADRRSGRSQQGYRCNLELLGQFQGQGEATVSASYGHCQYLGTVFTGTPRATHPGVNVVDMADPAHPVRTDSLT